MASTALAAALRQLRDWAAGDANKDLADHQLLERFAVQREEAAFATLMRRHGGLVLGAARRILHDVQAAEDVFQDTFLILARNAGSIRKRESLAAWLYGVASRQASRMRLRDARRTTRERAAVPPNAAEDVTEATAWRELGALLDEELARLPELLRTPLVLIYFAGQTQEEAARQMGWSKGTLRRRLEKGKRLLHARLLRRGVSLSIGLLAANIAQSAAEAALPPLLLARTMEQAIRTTGGELALGSLGVASLSRAKLALVLGMLIAGGAGVVALQTRNGEPPVENREPPPPPAREVRKPRVDRFGDPLPPGAIARLGTVRFRHARATTLAFTSDGKSLRSCGADQKLRTWDLATGRLLREQQLPSEAAVNSPFVLSPDGRLRAPNDVSEDSFWIWDIPRNQLRQLSLGKEKSWYAGVFSPDGKYLATVHYSGHLRAWDLAAGKNRDLGKDDWILSFTAASKLLMTRRHSRGIHFWDLASGSERACLDIAENFLGADLSPDGRIVAAWNHQNPDQDHGLRFWDATTGKPVKGWIPPPLKPIRTARFAPDGKTILIAYAEEILVWDPLAAKRIRTLPGKVEGHLAFSPDGKTVAALGKGFSFDPHSALIHVWNLQTGAPHAATTADSGHLGEVDAVAFAPDGRTIASTCGGERSLRVWDAATGWLLRALATDDRIFHSLTFSPDGKYLLDGQHRAIVRWEIASGREIARYPLFGRNNDDLHFLFSHLADDGRTLQAVSQNLGQTGAPWALHAWDMETGKRLRFVPFHVKDDWTSYGQFSPDGRWLALPGGSIYDAATGKKQFQLSAEGKKKLDMPVAFSPDGALLALGIKEEVKRGDYKSEEVVAVQVWEMATQRPAARLETGEVAHIAFTPDGRRLIAAGLDALALWDLASQRVVTRRPAPGRFRGSYGPSFASRLALAPDGRTVATGQHDTAILLWNLSPATANRSSAPLTAAQREAYWTDLAGDDAVRALRALARLADEPKQTVTLLRERLHPAQAPPAEELRRLLADLDEERFERRQAAVKRLTELDDLAHAALRAALQRKPSLEMRRRIEGLLARPPLARTDDARRHLRATRLLEQIATPEARQILGTLAKGTADTRRTRAAKAALARLARQPHP